MTSVDRLNSLQLARFGAAFSVVIFHGFRIGNQRLGIFDGLDFNVGRAGVDVFFVISGFIMAYTIYGRDESAGSFALRRLFRIVPLYWIFTSLIFAAALFAPSMLGATDADPADLVRSLLFIPYEKDSGLIQPLLYVGWTINYEMFFYAVFAGGMLLGGQRAPIVAAGVLLALFAAGQVYSSPDVAWRFYTDGVILEFIYGMGLHWLFRRNPEVFRTFWWGCPFGIALILAQLVYPVDLPRQIMFGLPAILIVGGMLGVSVRPSFLTTLGDASYSMYLAHPYVLAIVAVILGRLALPEPVITSGYIVASVAGVVAVSLISFYVIERPSNALGRSWLRSRRARVAS